MGLLPVLCAEWIKLNDSAPVIAPDAVSGGGGSVGMLRVKWLVSNSTERES